MSFSGNLSEFGVVALLQLPDTNHLSGKLVLEQAGNTAEFFYIKGKLLHAELGEITGKEALIEVIDWTDGNFAFDSSCSTVKVTIKQDLQNTLMWALKERDERKKKRDEQQQAARELAAKERTARESAARELAVQAQVAAAALASNLPEPVVLPRSLMTNSSTIQIAYLINSMGQVVAESEAETDFIQEIKPLLAAVKSFIRDYPAGTMGKSFIEDSNYILAVSGLSERLTTVIFVPHSTRLGVLSIELGKFVRALQSSGLEILND
ncbi:MAG: DUF4388 domain-containing protein [Candidatus Sabulitectum sp.]|nr:DUF4388 domain-containing protein [Candidatus Sabulitectum sp.]